MDPPPPYDNCKSQSPPTYASVVGPSDRPISTLPPLSAQPFPVSSPPPSWYPKITQPASATAGCYRLEDISRREPPPPPLVPGLPRSIVRHSTGIESYAKHQGLACIVCCCFNIPFGLVAYVLASMAEHARPYDRSRARCLGSASMCVSMSGIIVSAVGAVLLLGVCGLSGSGCRGVYHRRNSFWLATTQLPSSSSSACGPMMYEVDGSCYRSRRYVGFNRPRCTYDECCSRSMAELVYRNGFCYGELFSSANRSGGCPSSFIHDPDVDGCYKPMLEKSSWNNARESCSRLNSHLVVIDNPAEQQAITRLFQNNQRDFERHCANWGQGWCPCLHTAGHRVDQTTGFVWNPTDGESSLPMNYTNWIAGEPNNFKNMVENCVVVTSSKDGNGWNDIPCDFSACFICEIDLR